MRWSVLLGLGCQATEVETGLSTGSHSTCEAAAVPCDEERQFDLNLSVEPWHGEEPISTQFDGAGSTRLDAGGGSLEGALAMSWLYLAIGDDGWQRLEINDREADESTEWDLALRRQHIRLNSGSSGPGCTQGLVMSDRGWDEIVELPDGLVYFDESFYSDDCVLIEDTTELPGSPRLVLDGWWKDQGCVAMTGQVAVLRPVVGGALKMEVLSYYGSEQESCDAGEGGGVDGGLYEIRWQWFGSPG